LPQQPKGAVQPGFMNAQQPCFMNPFGLAIIQVWGLVEFQTLTGGPICGEKEGYLRSPLSLDSQAGQYLAEDDGDGTVLMPRAYCSSPDPGILEREMAQHIQSICVMLLVLSGSFHIGKTPQPSMRKVGGNS
jgi:hypothetical protein